MAVLAEKDLADMGLEGGFYSIHDNGIYIHAHSI